MPDLPLPLTDVGVGAWIAPRLGPFGGWVGSVVPRGVPAYARVLHPSVTDPPVTWAEVCAATGARPHALMQWSAITRGDDERWGCEAGGGSLEPRSLAALRTVLERHTAAGQDWFFAVWEGHGWVVGGGTRITFGDGLVREEPVPGAYPDDSARLRHPYRDYLLFRGPPSLVSGLGDPRGVWVQSPSLFWPADRSFCVATEIDFDSTLVTGSVELVAAVLADPILEAWPVDVDDSLAFDADTVNTHP